LKAINNHIQKKIIVGDEWLYYKIYCGVKTADYLLIYVIKPICERLLDNSIIDKWFFIRYSDPEPHLRVRFHSIKIENLGIIIECFKVQVMPYIISNQVWDVQLATYHRELNRYGRNTIKECESFFFYDSQHSINIIKNDEGDEKHFIVVFKWIEYLISLFKLNSEQQLSFLKAMQHQFKDEFKVHKPVNKTLNMKYKTLEILLYNDLTENNNNNIELKKITERLLFLKKEKQLNNSIEYLLSSFIHMSINRNFRSKQRLYEMMIYDFLQKKHTSKFARYGKV